MNQQEKSNNQQFAFLIYVNSYNINLIYRI